MTYFTPPHPLAYLSKYAPLIVLLISTTLFNTSHGQAMLNSKSKMATSSFDPHQHELLNFYRIRDQRLQTGTFPLSQRVIEQMEALRVASMIPPSPVDLPILAAGGTHAVPEFFLVKNQTLELENDLVLWSKGDVYLDGDILGKLVEGNTDGQNLSIGCGGTLFINGNIQLSNGGAGFHKTFKHESTQSLSAQLNFDKADLILNELNHWTAGNGGSLLLFAQRIVYKGSTTVGNGGRGFGKGKGGDGGNICIITDRLDNQTNRIFQAGDGGDGGSEAKFGCGSGGNGGEAIFACADGATGTHNSGSGTVVGGNGGAGGSSFTFNQAGCPGGNGGNGISSSGEGIGGTGGAGGNGLNGYTTSEAAIRGTDGGNGGAGGNGTGGNGKKGQGGSGGPGGSGGSGHESGLLSGNTGVAAGPGSRGGNGGTGGTGTGGNGINGGTGIGGNGGNPGIGGEAGTNGGGCFGCSGAQGGGGGNGGNGGQGVGGNATVPGGKGGVGIGGDGSNGANSQPGGLGGPAGGGLPAGTLGCGGFGSAGGRGGEGVGGHGLGTGAGGNAQGGNGGNAGLFGTGGSGCLTGSGCLGLGGNARGGNGGQSFCSTGGKGGLATIGECGTGIDACGNCTIPTATNGNNGPSGNLSACGGANPDCINGECTSINSVFWAITGEGNWSGAANWSSNSVPGYNSIATINPGGVAVLDGEFALYKLINNQGTIKGNGTLHFARIENNGSFSPGNSPGVINIVGDYISTSNAEIVIEIENDTTFDIINVSGSASLDGLLTINLLNGFTPSLGDVFTFLTAASISGEFAELSYFPALPNGLYWKVNYEANSVSLEVTDVAPPSPPDGNMLVFNGSAGINSAQAQGPLNLESFTIETWVKFNDPATGTNDWIAEIGNPAAGNWGAPGLALWFWYNNNNTYNSGYNKLHLGFAGSARDPSCNCGDFLYDFTPNPGAWYHLAYTYDAQTRKVNLFINGVSQGEQNNVGAPAPPYVPRPFLGLGYRIYGGVTSHQMNGAMDEFRIWNRARTAAEIQANYQTELGGQEDDLVVYYKFDQINSSPFVQNDCTPNRIDLVGGSGTGLTSETSTVPNLVDAECSESPIPNGVTKTFVGLQAPGRSNFWDDPNAWFPVGVPTDSDDVLIRNHSVFLRNGNNPITVRNLRLDGASAGIIRGNVNPAPSITVLDSFIWNAGSVRSGVTLITQGYTTITKPIGKLMQGALWNNEGDVLWTEGNLSMDNSSIQNSGTFELHANSPEQYKHSPNINPYGAADRRFINKNNGIFRVTRFDSSPSTYSSMATTNFTNEQGGLIESEISYLDIKSLINSGTLSILPNAKSLAFSGGSINPGTSILGSGATIHLLNTVNVNIPFNPGSNKIWIHSAPHVDSLGGTGAIATGDTLIHSAGKIKIPINILAGGFLNWQGSPLVTDKILASTLTNQGQLDWTGSNISFENGTLINNGTMNAIFPPGQPFRMIDSIGTNLFRNCGTFNNVSNASIEVPLVSCNILFGNFDGTIASTLDSAVVVNLPDSIRFYDPCSCRNNAAPYTNGQAPNYSGLFNDEIVILSPTNNDTWTIDGTSSTKPLPYFDNPNSGAVLGDLTQVAAGDIVPLIGSITEPNGNTCYIYRLPIIHRDSFGYSVSITDKSGKYTTVVDLNNMCAYPRPFFTALPDAICKDASITVTGKANISYGNSNFYIDNNLVASGAATLNFTLDASTLEPGNHTLKYRYDAGQPQDGMMDTICIQTVQEDFIVKPTPTTSASPDISVCNQNAVPAITLGGPVASTTHSWTNNTPAIGLAASGTGNIPSFTASNPGTTPLTARIIVTPTADGCTGRPDTFLITVKPTPTTSASSDTSVCNQNAVPAITLGGPVASTTHSWTNNTPAIGLAASGTGNIPSFTASNPGTTPLTARIIVTPTADGCTGRPDTFLITVKPTPTTSASSDTSVCDQSTVPTITFSNPVANTTYSWTNSTPSIGLAASGTGNIPAFVATFAGADSITAHLKVLATAEACVSDTLRFYIRVYGQPSLYELTGGGTICNTGTIIGQNIGLSGSQTTVRYQLLRNGAPVGSPQQGTGAALSFGLQTQVGSYTVQATSPQGCMKLMQGNASITAVDCDLDIKDPCVCENNSPKVLNGQSTNAGTFRESIEVNAPTGQNWTVLSSTGLYTDPAGTVLLAIGAPLLESPANSGVYLLSPVFHRDAVGYAIVVTNGNSTLQIGNKCFYPDPVFTGLPAALTRTQGSVQITGSAGTLTGSGRFVLDGNPVAQGATPLIFPLNPAGLSIGVHTLEFEFTANRSSTPDGTIDCQRVLTQTFEVSDKVECACQDIKVVLNEQCKFKLSPSLVSQGNCTESSTYVLVQDSDPSNRDTIDCAGTWTYGIFDQNGNIICWGKVTAEDKTPLAPVCMPADITLDCYDVNYVLNNRLTIGNVGDTKSPRPAATGSQTINNAEGVAKGTDVGDNCTNTLAPPALVADVVRNLGYAYFRDNCRDCGCRVTLKWSDKVVFYSCEQMATNGGIYATIFREWAATDCNGMRSDYTQQIKFTRPVVKNGLTAGANDRGLRFRGAGTAAPSTDTYDWIVEYVACTPDKSLIKKADVMPSFCSYFNTDANPRCLFLDEVECNYSVQIKDTEFPICGGKGVKIDRELYVFDWCAGGIVDTFHVLIKIGDFTPPALEYAMHAPFEISTGPMDCTAAFPISVAGIKSTFGVEVKDNCGVANVAVRVKTKDRYVKGILVATNTWEQVEYAVMNGMMIGLPVGTHRLIIDAYDGCYNAKRDSFTFEVQDKIAPIMKCDDDLHVTLSNANGYTNGYAQLNATDIDEGSSDNCKLAWMAVRRNVPTSCAASFLAKGYDTNNNGQLDPLPADGDWTKADGFDINGDGDLADFGETFILKEGKLMTPLQDIVEFFCCDLSERVTIELWGEDIYGNRNFCWNDLLLEDKVTPTCVAPWNVTIDCDDKGLEKIDDRAASSALWGDVTVSSGADCASLDIVYSTVKKLKCGAGYIDRIWTLTKQTSKGPITITCTQRITINPVWEYNICFPKDISTDCKTPIIDTVIVDELGCDILAVNVFDKRYDASDDECYKIFRTYSVINWCTYEDRCGDPLIQNNQSVINRAVFGNYGRAPIYVLVRDSDRDQDEEFYISENLTPNEKADIHILGDPDRNGSASGTGYNSTADPVAMPYCSVAQEYYHSFIYTQIIKVYDDTRPVVTGIRDTFCTDPAACAASITKVVTLKDNCSDKVELERQMLMIAPFQTLEAGKMIMYSTPRWSTKDLGNGQFEIKVSNLPEGLHDLIVVGRDECGNLSVPTRIPFLVKDCKAPAPICINGLSTELMPDGNGGGMMAVWASDFVASKIYDCNGQGTSSGDPSGRPLVTKYSINRVGSAVVATQTGINLTCADAGKTILVELHAWDEAGNHDFCVTYIEVQDNRKVCGSSATQAEISGVITTDDLKPVLGVNVDLSGGAQMNQNTGSNGVYLFGNLTKGSDYTVSPQLDKDHLNGVSTFDLVQIQKHILGVKAIDNPYRMIAADVNNSKSISTLDIIQIRKLILNIDTKFSSVPSWKFVDASYKFPDPSTPWSAQFPEVANVNDLDGKMQANFIAIKMGDVNGNASTNGAVATEARSDKSMLIRTDEQQLQSGQSYTVVFKAKDLAKIQGYQFTLSVDPSLATIEGIDYTGVMKPDNFGIFTKDGMITSSFVRAPLAGAGAPVQGQPQGLPLRGDDILFTLKLKAESNTALSRAMDLNSRLTNQEAYNQSEEVMGVQLAFNKATVTDRTTLFQNVPNPFSTETTVVFYLPKATKATLIIRDAKGALVYRVENNYPKGNSQVLLKQEHLKVGGVLYYTLETSDFIDTRKMVLLQN